MRTGWVRRYQLLKMTPEDRAKEMGVVVLDDHESVHGGRRFTMEVPTFKVWFFAPDRTTALDEFTRDVLDSVGRP